MQDKVNDIQESGEMYLETILRLKQVNSCIRAVNIVEELNFTKSSVSRGVNILKEKGFITIGEEGSIEFTQVGKERAQEIYERHRILTEYLTLIGVDRVTAEEDACRIEHVISEKTFKAIENHCKK